MDTIKKAQQPTSKHPSANHRLQAAARQAQSYVARVLELDQHPTNLDAIHTMVVRMLAAKTSDTPRESPSDPTPTRAPYHASLATSKNPEAPRLSSTADSDFDVQPSLTAGATYATKGSSPTQHGTCEPKVSVESRMRHPHIHEKTRADLTKQHSEREPQAYESPSRRKTAALPDRPRQSRVPFKLASEIGPSYANPFAQIPDLRPPLASEHEVYVPPILPISRFPPPAFPGRTPKTPSPQQGFHTADKNMSPSERSRDVRRADI